MRTNTRTLKVMIAAAILIGAPLAAGAQTAPPPTPLPRVAPAPVLMPIVTIPDQALKVLKDEALWRSLDELKLLSFDNMKLSLDNQLQVLDLATPRLAMMDARFDMTGWEMSGWDMQDPYGPNMLTYRTGSDYTAGKDLLNQRKYEQAIAQFDRVINKKAANVDGALYWKAFAHFKLGKTDESLAAITQLRRDHAQSRYLIDAKVLEADARRRAGQPVNPSEMDDDEMKLLAINAMKNTDPERAIPLLEGVLNSTNSFRLKNRALFVLASINQPRAHQILVGYAKGGGNPDLQLEAIRYLASSSNKQTTGTQLMEIYQSTSDTDVKLAIIGALRSSGNGNQLVNIVNTTGSPIIVRQSALSGLSGTLGPTELWTLYEKETTKELKLQMVSLFGSMQALDQLSRIVKTEKDLDVRRRAVRQLGNMKSDKTGQMLVDAYVADPDTVTRQTVISALAAQNNAEGLVAIARKESSLPLKTEIVRRLAEMAPKSKVAADYLMEIIK